ncbi:hypothetical protein [Flaviaesturariibacter amylovorans]|uniref:DUF3445 domain-containing protein n=1 Tax=Flaviaesturariibacter amylovorans TaxID=1084520 RepID=A0ABP8GL23_9BACT
MLYLHLVSNQNFITIPRSASTITHRFNVIETIVGGNIKSPYDDVDSLTLSNEYITNFSEAIRKGTKIKGIGIQVYVPLEMTSAHYITRCADLISVDDYVDRLAFITPLGNVVISSCKGKFPEHVNRKGEPTLSRFAEVSINIFKPETAFNMTPVYLNFITSPQFHLELTMNALVTIDRIPDHGNLWFQGLKYQIVQHLKTLVNHYNSLTLLKAV